MVEGIDDLKEIFKNIKEENIFFDKHFFKRIDDRPYLNKELIFNSIKKIENLTGFQKQLIGGEERYRIGIKLSKKYTLVLIVQIEDKNLYIKTAWKTSRKWQKSIQK